MPKSKIDVFSEGKTEKEIFTQFAKRIFTDVEFQERGGGGVDEMLKSLQQRIKSQVELQTETTELLNILVVRDCDKHLKQTIEFVRDNTLEYIQPYFQNAVFQADTTHQNIFNLQIEAPTLKLVLHVADKKYMSDFIKTTVDDYVLDLALRLPTIKILLDKKKVEGERQKPKRDWQAVTEDGILNKVKSEIPALLLSNKIPPVIEAKELLRIYATVFQEHVSPAVIAGKLLANAEEKDIREVFAPLIAATQLLA